MMGTYMPKRRLLSGHVAIQAPVRRGSRSAGLSGGMPWEAPHDTIDDHIVHFHSDGRDRIDRW